MSACFGALNRSLFHTSYGIFFQPMGNFIIHSLVWQGCPQAGWWVCWVLSSILLWTRILPVSFCAPHSLYCRIKGELWGFHLLRVQAGEGWRKKADFGKKLCGSSLPVSSLPLLRQDLIGTKGRNQEMNKEKGYVLQAHCLFVWVCGFFVCLFVCF